MAASIGLTTEHEELQTYVVMWDLRPYLMAASEVASAEN